MGSRDTYVPREKSSGGAHHESWQRLVILPSIVKDLEWLEGWSWSHRWVKGY